jgi:hypothetical protein
MAACHFSARDLEEVSDGDHQFEIGLSQIAESRVGGCRQLPMLMRSWKLAA